MADEKIFETEKHCFEFIFHGHLLCTLYYSKLIPQKGKYQIQDGFRVICQLFALTMAESCFNHISFDVWIKLNQSTYIKLDPKLDPYRFLSNHQKSFSPLLGRKLLGDMAGPHRPSDGPRCGPWTAPSTNPSPLSAAASMDPWSSGICGGMRRCKAARWTLGAWWLVVERSWWIMI